MAILVPLNQDGWFLVGSVLLSLTFDGSCIALYRGPAPGRVSERPMLTGDHEILDSTPDRDFEHIPGFMQ